MRKEGEIRTIKTSVMIAFALVFFLGAGLAQEEKTAKRVKDVEAVISGVGQRTITFQYERKGKVRQEVVGVDDRTDIERAGTKIKLRDLQETDKVIINYEPDAYTPAISVKVVGKGEVKKAGAED